MFFGGFYSRGALVGCIEVYAPKRHVRSCVSSVGLWGTSQWQGANQYGKFGWRISGYNDGEMGWV